MTIWAGLIVCTLIVFIRLVFFGGNPLPLLLAITLPFALLWLWCVAVKFWAWWRLYSKPIDRRVRF